MLHFPISPKAQLIAQLEQLIGMRSYARHQGSQHCFEWLSISPCSLQIEVPWAGEWCS